MCGIKKAKRSRPIGCGFPTKHARSKFESCNIGTVYRVVHHAIN